MHAGDVPPSPAPAPESKRLGPIVFAVAVLAVGAFVAIWWSRPDRSTGHAPSVKDSDSSHARGGEPRDSGSRTDPRPALAAGTESPRHRAASVVERLLRAIDDRDLKAFTEIASRGADAGSPRDPETIREQLEFLHVKYGGRPHRLGAVIPSAVVDGKGNLGPTRYPVGVLFGDREDLLTIDVDADGRVVSFHEDDPLTFAEPDGGEAPAK